MWFKDTKSGRIIVSRAFSPTDASPPKLSHILKQGKKVTPMLYCNLHGLWEGETFTV